MTGLSKYKKGLELEAEGFSGAEIAEKLGYHNTQAWYDAKNYYSKKQAAFNARAKGEAAQMPEPLPREEKPELPAEEEAPRPARVPRLKQEPQYPPLELPEAKKTSPPALTALKPLSISYKGKFAVYALHTNGITFNMPFDIPGTRQDLKFDLKPAQVLDLLDDLKDLATVLQHEVSVEMEIPE